MSSMWSIYDIMGQYIMWLRIDSFQSFENTKWSFPFYFVLSSPRFKLVSVCWWSFKCFDSEDGSSGECYVSTMSSLCASIIACVRWMSTNLFLLLKLLQVLYSKSKLWEILSTDRGTCPVQKSETSSTYKLSFW